MAYNYSIANPDYEMYVVTVRLIKTLPDGTQTPGLADGPGAWTSDNSAVRVVPWAITDTHQRRAEVRSDVDAEALITWQGDGDLGPGMAPLQTQARVVFSRANVGTNVLEFSIANPVSKFSGVVPPKR